MSLRARRARQSSSHCHCEPEGRGNLTVSGVMLRDRCRNALRLLRRLRASRKDRHKNAIARPPQRPRQSSSHCHCEPEGRGNLSVREVMPWDCFVACGLLAKTDTKMSLRARRARQSDHCARIASSQAPRNDVFGGEAATAAAAICPFQILLVKESPKFGLLR